MRDTTLSYCTNSRGTLNTKSDTDHLRTERVEVKTGNAMIDQLVP